MSDPTATEMLLRAAVSHQDELTRRAIARVDEGADRMLRSIAEQAAQNMTPEDRERYLSSIGVRAETTPEPTA